MKTKFIIFIYLVFSFQDLTQSDFQHILNTKETTLREPSSISHREAEIKVKKSKRLNKQKKEEASNQKRIANSKKKYLYFSKYPHTSTPVDSEKAEDHLKQRYINEPEVLSLEDVEIKLWSEKLYYNKSIEKVNVFFQLDQEYDERLIIPSLEFEGKKIPLKKMAKKRNLFQVEINEKLLSEGNYRVTLIIDKKEAISTSFAIREHYFSYKGFKKDEITSTGDLLFTTLFDIYMPGDYLIEGTLYYNNKIIAQGENIVSLNTGLKNIGLSFYGKILYQKEIDGNLVLKNVSLSYINSDLSSKNFGLIESNIKSGNYQFDQFHNRDYNDEVLLSKVKH